MPRPDDAWTALYRVHWVEGNEVKKSSLKGSQASLEHMQRLLSQGITSWMVPVPWEDDDIPF